MLKRGTLVLCCVLLCTIGASAAKLRGGLSDPAAAPNQEPSQDILLAAGAPADELGRALGMQSGEIPDSALSASTIHGWNEYYGPRNARLLGGHDYGCFIPNNNAANEWVQVDLGRIRPVGGVAFQGRRTGSYWVRNFFIQYSAYNQNDWTWYTDSGTGERKEFSGNWDENTIVSHVFTRPFEARYIRVYANQFQGWPCWRFELYAPKNDAESSGESLGLAGYTIPDSAFSASSAHGNNWGYYGPQNARLYAIRNWGGWIPNQNRLGEWVQVDLGKEVEVGGVATQGTNSGSYWVTVYRLAYSNDGSTWTNVLDDCNTAQTGDQSRFLANHNSYEVVKHQLQKPFKARFVRLIVDGICPNGWPALRWDLFAPEAPSNRLGMPLGVANPNSNFVPDSALTASSAHGNNWDYYGPKNARLGRHLNWGGWIPNYQRAGEWIQVDFGKIKTIGGIATQGAAPGYHWITKYNIMYSLDNNVWHTYMLYGEPQEFPGNVDYYTVRTHVFAVPFLARYVRIVAVAFSNWPALRFELYAPSSAPIEEAKRIFGAPLGMENGDISDDKIKASSTFGSVFGAGEPKNARLNGRTGAGAWLAGTNDRKQWIQVEVDPQVPLGGISVQGRNPKSDQFSGANQWITSYRVAVSSDGNNWNVLQRYQRDRIFRGNLDTETPVPEIFRGTEGIKTRFVRIMPEGWHGHISLRFEVYNTAKYQTEVVEKMIAERKAAEEAIRAKQAQAEKEAKEAEEAAKRKEAEEQARIKAAEEEKRVAEETVRKAATAAAKEAAEKALAEVEARLRKLEVAKEEAVAHAKATADRLKTETDRLKNEIKAAEVRLEALKSQNDRMDALKRKVGELKGILEQLRQDADQAAVKRAQFYDSQIAVDNAIVSLTTWLEGRGKAAEDEEEKERLADEEAAKAKAAAEAAAMNTPTPTATPEVDKSKEHNVEGDTDNTVGPDVWPRPQTRPGEGSEDSSVPVAEKTDVEK